jgi:hypothetical protein
LTPINLKEGYFIFKLRNNFFFELLFLMKIILILSTNIFRTEFVDFFEKYTISVKTKFIVTVGAA